MATAPSPSPQLQLPTEKFRASLASLHELSVKVNEITKQLQEQAQALAALTIQFKQTQPVSKAEQKKQDVMLAAAVNKLVTCELSQQALVTQLRALREDYAASQRGVVDQLMQTHEQLNQLRQQRLHTEGGAAGTAFDYRHAPDESALFQQDCFQ